MLPESFVIIFTTYVYTMYIPTMGSQRQHVFRVYVIRSNCAWLHNFFFLMIDYFLIIGGVGINMFWVEKNRKNNNQWGDDYSGHESMYTKNHFFTIHMGTKKIFYPQKTNTRKPFLRTIINWTKHDHELIVYNIII